MIFGRKPKVEAAATDGAAEISPEVARRFADAAEAAGSERVIAIEHATERLSRYLRDHRNVVLTAAPLILAGTHEAPELVLEQDGGFTMSSIDAEGTASMDRVSVAEVVELWGAADLYDRIEAALRSAAGLAPRPTGAIVAGLGVAGDDRASV
ncbi:MAG: hypothetical protein EBU83_01005 [bacterium]|jgi:hypothetical protein|nr:hypothetical protein [Candidatus Aquidulcis sp.]